MSKRQVQEVLRLSTEDEERALYGLGNRTLRRLRDRLGVRVAARGGSVTAQQRSNAPRLPDGAARPLRRMLSDSAAR